MHDIKIGNDVSMIKVEESWALVGIDMVEINKTTKVLETIDYNSRYVYARCIK